MKTLLLISSLISMYGSAAAKSSTENWVGEWSVDQNVISISQEKGKLKVHGNAVFTSGSGMANEGTVDGVAAPKGKSLTVKQDDCELALTLKANELEAKDNGQCGGLNVSFNGTYRKKK